VDKLINLFNQYYDGMMDWYQALTFLEQMGVLFGRFFHCSKMTIRHFDADETARTEKKENK
jgi:hypothetical protein